VLFVAAEKAAARVGVEFGEPLGLKQVGVCD
jgi:hypothetical protein